MVRTLEAEHEIVEIVLAARDRDSAAAHEHVERLRQVRGLAPYDTDDEAWEDFARRAGA